MPPVDVPGPSAVDPADANASAERASGPPVGIALSGGGHRAAMFAAGTLLAVVDAGLQSQTVSIASVSGGSLTNGAVAVTEDFSKSTRHSLEQTLGPVMNTAAHRGLLYSGEDTDAYVGNVAALVNVTLMAFAALLAAMIGAGRGWSWTLIATVTAVVGVAITFGLAAALASTIRPAPRVAIVGRSLLGAPAALLIPAGQVGVRDGTPPTTIATLLGFALVVVWFFQQLVKLAGRRSLRLESALDKSLFDGTRLSAFDQSTRPVHHLFCPTELTTGDHMYLSPRLVYGFRVGAARPHPGLRFATAVQASACFPGAFSPRVFSTDQLGATSLRRGIRSMSGEPIRTVALTDGGVYDNMADQWEFGFENRRVAFPDDLALGDVQEVRAELLLVVNAGGRLNEKPLKEGGLTFEVNALMRCKDVLYDVSTALRRRYIVDTFGRHARQRPLHGEASLAGTLIHIAQSPYRIPELFVTSDDPQQVARARYAIALLEALDERAGRDAGDRTYWDTCAKSNHGIKTVLSPLGTPVCVNLMHHAYLLTRINPYVILGAGTIPRALNEHTLEPFERARFATLIDDARGALFARAETAPRQP